MKRREEQNNNIHVTENWERHTEESWGETIFRDYDWEFFRFHENSGFKRYPQIQEVSSDSRRILNPKHNCGENADQHRQEQN